MKSIIALLIALLARETRVSDEESRRVTQGTEALRHQVQQAAEALVESFPIR